MHNLIKISLSVLIILFSLCGIGQNNITLSNKGAIYIDFQPVAYAGLKNSTIKNDSQWLNYTTLVNPNDPSMSIMVEIMAGSVPDGMEMYVEASPYQGISKGKMGNATGKVKLGLFSKELITNIKTCYSGSQRNEGHKLTYTFNITDFSKISSGTSNISIIYTISQ